MPVLAYCIAEAEPLVEVPTAGIHEAKIETLQQAGLRCFLSHHAAKEEIVHRPLQDAALAFNRVLQQVFRQVAIVPFRFPTVLADGDEIVEFLQQHAQEYREALDRLRNLVQMEVHIGLPKPQAVEKQRESSGAQYLQSRLTQHRRLEGAAQEIRRAGESSIRDWRERHTNSGGLRCYALVERDTLQTFRDQVGSVLRGPELQIRLSGPWPASEFLQQNGAGR